MDTLSKISVLTKDLLYCRHAAWEQLCCVAYHCYKNLSGKGICMMHILA